DQIGSRNGFSAYSYRLQVIVCQLAVTFKLFIVTVALGVEQGGVKAPVLAYTEGGDQLPVRLRIIIDFIFIIVVIEFTAARQQLLLMLFVVPVSFNVSIQAGHIPFGQRLRNTVPGLVGNFFSCKMIQTDHGVFMIISAGKKIGLKIR